MQLVHEFWLITLGDLELAQELDLTSSFMNATQGESTTTMDGVAYQMPLASSNFSKIRMRTAKYVPAFNWSHIELARTVKKKRQINY